MKNIIGIEVIAIEDYNHSVRIENGTESLINLPKSNVLKYCLADGSWFCLRPSGTEPKVKFYFGVRGESMEESQKKLSLLQTDIMNKVKSNLK